MLRTIELDYLPKYKVDYLINNTKNLKHKCAFLLMCDAGMRVTEALSLKLENFDFREKIICIDSLKKREKAKFKKRLIPITSRLYNCLLNYVPTLKSKTSDTWLFTNDKGEQMQRFAINKALSRFKAKHSGFENLHPHALRHSYATFLLSKGESIDTIQRLLGHENSELTQAYAHIPTNELKRLHSEAFEEKETFTKRLKSKLFGKKDTPILNINPLPNELMIGRDSLMYEINDKLSRNINVILLGKTGVGKSTMIKNINTTGRKVLTIDDVSEMKTTLINMLLYLLDDKEKVMELMFGEYDKTKVKTKISRHSLMSLAKNICDIVEPQEYILVIDSVDRISPRVVSVLEQLKEHFTIVTSAREIAVNKTSFLWNFETIKVEELCRKDSIELVSKLSGTLEVEDYEQYKNYIWNKSNGNPRVIYEMIDRFRKEPFVCKDTVRSIDHYGSLPTIDMSLVLLCLFGCGAIFRYLGRESGNTSLTFIGGIAMILLILSRYFFQHTKHRFLR